MILPLPAWIGQLQAQSLPYPQMQVPPRTKPQLVTMRMAVLIALFFCSLFNETLYKFTEIRNSLIWYFWRAIIFITGTRNIEKGHLLYFLFFFFFFFKTITFLCWVWQVIYTVLNITVELSRGPVGQILCLEKEVLVLEKNQLLLSPLLCCFFSWGFPDNSCAFGNHATEKVLCNVNAFYTFP